MGNLLLNMKDQMKNGSPKLYKRSFRGPIVRRGAISIGLIIKNPTKREMKFHNWLKNSRLRSVLCLLVFCQNFNREDLIRL